MGTEWVLNRGQENRGDTKLHRSWQRFQNKPENTVVVQSS